MSVLVVDDSRVMRSIVMRALQHAGYGEHATVQAASGAEALQALQSATPNLILSDWTMAAMTGLELLHAVRAAGLGVPFGFIAASGDPDMRRAARAAGAAFFLAKPFTPQALREALAAVLERPLAPPTPSTSPPVSEQHPVPHRCIAREVRTRPGSAEPRDACEDFPTLVPTPGREG